MSHIRKIFAQGKEKLIVLWRYVSIETSDMGRSIEQEVVQV